MTQLEPDLDADWRTMRVNWHRGLPDRRDPLSEFTHLIRHPDDPERMSRKERQAKYAHLPGRANEVWKSDLKGDPREWAAAIIRLLRRAPEAMTFNGIVLSLTGNEYTADVAFERAPDHGLWLAVERGRVWWANCLGCVRFSAPPRFVQWEGCASA